MPVELKNNQDQVHISGEFKNVTDANYTIWIVTDIDGDGDTDFSDELKIPADAWHISEFHVRDVGDEKKTLLGSARSLIGNYIVLQWSAANRGNLDKDAELHLELFTVSGGQRTDIIKFERKLKTASSTKPVLKSSPSMPLAFRRKP